MSPAQGAHRSSQLVIGFAGAAHALHHIITAIFPTVVLAITVAWQRPYEELIALWTIGALLLGAAAPLAGWLSDRFGERRLMIVYLLGIGLAAILAGQSRTPGQLELALAAIGMLGAIYHPVGTAWVVRHAEAKGRAIAIVGTLGSAGVAAASLVAGVLTDLVSWRAAFVVPGAFLVATGLLLVLVSSLGLMEDRSSDRNPDPPAEAANMRRTILLLVVAMCLTSLLWHAFQTMLPKWLGRELAGALGSGLTNVGGLVTLIFMIGMVGQLVGGHLADKGRIRDAFVASFALKLAVLLVATQVTGWPVIPVAMLIALVFDLAAPIENVLVARYAPEGRRGVAYGLRHGLAMVSAPLGVQLVASTYDEARGFVVLLLAMAALTLAMLLAVLLLPTDRAPVGATTPAT